MREALQRERTRNRARVRALTESHAATVGQLTAQLRSTTARLDETSAALAEARVRCGALAERVMALAPPTELESDRSQEFWLEVPFSRTTDEDSDDTFKIRYHTDSSYFTASNASSPIFVSMGGEGTSSGAGCSSTAAARVSEFGRNWVGSGFASKPRSRRTRGRSITNAAAAS